MLVLLFRSYMSVVAHKEDFTPSVGTALPAPVTLDSGTNNVLLRERVSSSAWDLKGGGSVNQGFSLSGVFPTA